MTSWGPGLATLMAGTALVAGATFLWSDRGILIVLDFASAGISAFCL